MTAAFAGLVLVLPAVASAAPSVSMNVRILPVPVNLSNPNGGFWPHTGDLLGAPAALEANFSIRGTEYGGFPAPIRRVAVYLPQGTGIDTGGFVKCPTPTLESHEVQKCPSTSLAGPKGSAHGVVSFGETRVPETVTVQPFFSASGLAFFVEGRTPASIELLSQGSLTSGGGPFSQKLTAEVPLVATVPGAPYASTEEINVEVGAEMMHGKELISLGTIPKECPTGGFKLKAELTFGASEGPTGETVTVTTTVPCPPGGEGPPESSVRPFQMYFAGERKGSRHLRLSRIVVLGTSSHDRITFACIVCNGKTRHGATVAHKQKVTFAVGGLSVSARSKLSITVKAPDGSSRARTYRFSIAHAELLLESQRCFVARERTAASCKS